jgi:hypothetical protein
MTSDKYSCDIDSLLNNEIKKERKKWSKLLLSEKMSKVKEYVNTSEYNDEKKKTLCDYLIAQLKKKRFSRDKDVDYDFLNDTLISISGLVFNEATKKFTISNYKRNKTKKNK